MPAWADDERHDDERHFPQAATFSTLITTPHDVEGLTGDNLGNLYTAARDIATPSGIPGMCPVWRINIDNPSLVVVGYIPPPSVPASTQFSWCSPLGLAFDHAGKLFVTDRNKIYSFFPDAEHPPVADLFASGVPGTNGIVFDRDGNLWTGDSTTGQGRVWKITPQGTVTEVFRVQAMSNDVTAPPHNSGFGGVGRAVVYTAVSLNVFELFSRYIVSTGLTQPMVASGLAFDKHGNLFVSATARGAIWRVQFDRFGNLQSRTNCDTTFPANTLCLDNLFVAHPFLEGADGIALDHEGNIWVSVGERNAVVAVTHKRVIEVFRNEPDAVTRLRNDGPLDYPTSPFLSDGRFCTANSQWGALARNLFGSQNKGKISCMDQRLSIPGMPLPVR